MGSKMKGKTKGQESRVTNESSNESINNVSENNNVLSQFLQSENSSDNLDKNKVVIQTSSTYVACILAIFAQLLQKTNFSLASKMSLH